MRLAVPLETSPHERRVALVPDLVDSLTTAGYEVVLEPAAGAASGHPDAEYAAAGATVDRKAMHGAEAVLAVNAPGPSQVARLAPGAVVVSMMQPLQQLDVVRAHLARGTSAYSLDLMPRISRAQVMDALSSQALVSGYRAAIIAADRLPRLFPLLMTAAGTVTPARVLVLGTGVAGLQAIATARRLGALVSGYDVRVAAAEEVRSLGATFVNLGMETQEGEGGYARGAAADYLDEQRALLAPHVAEADVVITTAAVPGRQAPLLVTTAMVAAMRPGSVVVDLAAESGGNVEASRPGEDVEVAGVTVVGCLAEASNVPVHASQLYARNATSLLLLLTREGALAPDFSDEIVWACCVVRDGEVAHEPTREALAATPRRSTASKASVRKAPTGKAAREAPAATRTPRRSATSPPGSRRRGNGRTA